MGDGVHGDHGVVITTQERNQGPGHVTIQLHFMEEELALGGIRKNPAVKVKISKCAQWSSD